jgi:Sec-independent protein translocase protein TatA
MIGLSFVEIIIILLIMILVINPKDIPTIIKYFKKFRSQFNHLNDEFKTTFNKIASETEAIAFNNEEELKEINRLLQEICDNGGKYEGEYDLTEIRKVHSKLTLSQDKNIT